MGCTSGQPFQYREEVARQMSLALQQKDVYNQMKLNDIDSIRNFLNTNSNRMTCEEKFQVNVDLYNEFKLYSFDSAFHYATQLCRIANDIDSSAYRVDARPDWDIF